MRKLPVDFWRYLSGQSKNHIDSRQFVYGRVLNTNILIFLDNKKGKWIILISFPSFSNWSNFLETYLTVALVEKSLIALKYADQPGAYITLGFLERRGWLYLQSENQHLLNRVPIVPGRDYCSLKAHWLYVS